MARKVPFCGSPSMKTPLESTKECMDEESSIHYALCIIYRESHESGLTLALILAYSLQCSVIKLR
jgi:hypothetical protein